MRETGEYDSGERGTMATAAIPWKGHARYSRKYHDGAEAGARHDNIGTNTIKESWKQQHHKDMDKSAEDDLDHVMSLGTLRRRHVETVMITRGGLQVGVTRHALKTPSRSGGRMYCISC
jgi:hypothetical protein